jgi:hypothetical protein
MVRILLIVIIVLLVLAVVAPRIRGGGRRGL